ncbi:hypothetical protein GCM10023116_20120 [Kistimonas scapharcae]|uniref:Uncharacterized protein n=1 Tax=Kistimonas scapharcae TaxID=1036133 RepID=A0ABP8V1N4_9GAMM
MPLAYAETDKIPNANNGGNYDVFNIANHSEGTIRAEYREEITTHLVKTSDPIEPNSYLQDKIFCEYTKCTAIYIRFIDSQGKELCIADTKEAIYKPEQTYAVNYYKLGSCDIRRTK